MVEIQPITDPLVASKAVELYHVASQLRTWKEAYKGGTRFVPFPVDETQINFIELTPHFFYGMTRIKNSLFRYLNRVGEGNIGFDVLKQVSDDFRERKNDRVR